MDLRTEAATQRSAFRGTLACEDYEAILAMSERARVPQGQFPIGFQADAAPGGNIDVRVYTMAASSIEDARQQLYSSDPARVRSHDATFTAAEFLGLFRRFELVGWNTHVLDVIVSARIDVDG